MSSAEMKPRQLSAIRTAGMVMHYEQLGRGCERIAHLYGLTRQAVHERLKRAGVQMRPLYKKLLPAVEFNGMKYTPGKDGYYHRTTGDRRVLSRDVYEFYRCPVPDDCEIVYADGDKTNNDIGNLICMTRADAARFMHPQHEIPNPPHCRFCGEPLRRQIYHCADGKTRSETPSALMRRQFCNRDHAYCYRRLIGNK